MGMILVWLLMVCLIPFHIVGLFMNTGFNSSVLAGVVQASALLTYAVVSVTLLRRDLIRGTWQAVLVGLAYPVIVFGTNMLFGPII